MNYLDKWIDQLEKNEAALKQIYTCKTNFSVKKYITDFVKVLTKSKINIAENFSMLIPEPKDLSAKFHLIKFHAKDSINTNGQHYLSCEFGEGYFSAPKTIDKNAYCKEKHCHSTAYLFALSHPELKPTILTGFYNRMEDELTSYDKGFLHSVCLFSNGEENKIFDGSHAIIMDEKLYKNLFNFKTISSLDFNLLLTDLAPLKDHDFDILEYLLDRESVLKKYEFETTEDGSKSY